MRKLIMDVDTGSDDAIAIMLALLSDSFDVAAICTTALLPIYDVTENTLKVLHLIRKNVPVYMGAPCAMVKTLSPLRMRGARLNQSIEINGKTLAMHNVFELDRGDMQPEKRDAVSFYLDALSDAEDEITIVATAPLTNLALALTADRSIARNIKELVIMGGGYIQSNVTSRAESNFWRDPEAAQKVLSCGANITLLPLDATHSAAFTTRERDRIASIPTPAARFATRLINERMMVYTQKQPLAAEPLAPLHDALCIAYLLRPEVILESRFCHCEVDCSDGAAQGGLIVDNRAFTEKPNVTLAMKADGVLLCDLLCEAFASEVCYGE